MNKSRKSLRARLRDRKADIGRVFLAMVFIALVLYPMVRMFAYMDGESIQKVVTAPSFGTTVVHSLVSAGLSTAITVVLAYALAMCTERSGIRLKSLFAIIFALPMLIPSISNGMGLIILFGNNGLITRLLHLDGGIYGLPGIVMGSVLYAFPVAYLMLADVLKYEDASPYEAARVLGIGRGRQFAAITFPYLRKPMISLIFATFSMIVTDYGVPLMVGGKYTTIPVVLYQEVIGQLNFGKGAVYGCLLLIPAVAAFVLDLLNRDRGNSAYVAKPFAPDGSLGKKVLSYLCCGAVAAFVLLNLISFGLLAFSKDYPADLSFTLDNILKTLRMKADDYFLNSLLIALFASVLGVAVSFATAYFTARMHSAASRFLHLASITSEAIPGVVLGLSYVIVFKGSPLYGTIAILVMVNIIHFIASPYLMIYNSLSKLNANLEGVGHTLGIRRSLMIRDVLIPQCRGTLLEMFAYFFTNSMMTISAVSFLATTENKPVSLMINQFEAQTQLECAAVVSLAILAANLLIKGVVYLCKSAQRRRSPVKAESSA